MKHPTVLLCWRVKSTVSGCDLSDTVCVVSEALFCSLMGLSFHRPIGTGKHAPCASLTEHGEQLEFLSLSFSDYTCQNSVRVERFFRALHVPLLWNIAQGLSK